MKHSLIFGVSAALLMMAGGLYGQAKPTFAPGTPVTNVGGGYNEFAPGSLAYVRGANLATTAVSAQPPYPATLAGTTVTFTQSGATFAAALLDAQPDRLTIQIPYGLKRGSATLKVTAAGGEVSRSLSIIEVAPRPVATQVMAFFLQEAYHADGRGITEGEPAKPGEEIRVIVQGLGETAPPIAAGQLPGDGSENRPYNAVAGPISARFDQTEAEVRFARLSPGRPGMYEVGVVVPADVRAAQYLFAIRHGEGAWLSGGIIWAGWRVIRLTDTWNGQACEMVDSAPVEVPYDAYLNRLETWVEMPLGVSWVNFRLLNEAGEPVLSSVVSVQSCDEANPSWCLVGRGSLKVTLPAGNYTLELPPGDYTPEQGQPRLCKNTASGGQALSRLYGAWAPSNWSTAGEGVLAAEGGSVQAPGFELTAESGALEEPASIRVSALVKEEEMSGGRITPFFRLEGLPVELRAPVTVTLDAPGAPDGEVTLLMRAEDSAGAPIFLRGTVADGKLTAQLPVEGGPEVPEAGAKARLASTRSASLQKSGKVSWLLWGVMGLKPNNYEEHFIIHAPDSAYPVMRKVGKALEKAYQLIGTMGLDWSKRGDAPIEVYLFSYKSWSSLVLGGVKNAAGNTETGVWGKTNVGICLDLDSVSDESDPGKIEDLSITAGHELLHIMQAQYDNTGITTSGWTWLFEAAAVWLERALASDPNFVSPHAKSYMYFLYTDPLEVQSWP
jgi:uncharacterized protein (TIGR03437 family)